jgi:hypothetical protein
MTGAGLHGADHAMERMFKPGAIRALILSGRNNHDWRTTTPHLRNLLLASGRFDVRVTEEPAGLTGASVAPYDVFVIDYNGPRWGAAAEQAVESAVRSGKGLVVVHGASWAFGDMEILADNHVRTGIREPAWKAYAAMTGAAWSDAEPKSGHARRHIYEVKMVNPSHPVAAGFGGFTISDELYHNLRMQPGIEVLATAFDNPAIGGTGKNEPVMWTVAYGKGRVFHTALGHDVAAMMSPGFVTSFTRGAEWAATAKVTLPVKLAPDAPAGSPRVLVVTGGHNHEASFYTMLESFSGFLIDVNPHPTAYNSDLRKQYDVLVLYDLVQTLDDRQRRNLREFVESGKGVVALHHAIADFNDWPWWWQEVIGGRYLLKPDGDQPASMYQHDEEMRVRPAREHPILRGVPELHLWDETYRKMWISPKALVLLTTDNPTADPPVAWVSPYEKSRVVYIQLGHGRASHEYPGYRTLVRNAILWSSGGIR